MANDFIDIDPEDLRELVQDRGETFDWWKARPCPCSQSQDADNESTDSESCPFGCTGGFLFELQTLPENVVAIVTDFNKTVYHPDFGRVPSGTAKWIGMADEVLLGDRDRVTLTSNARAEPVREVVKRGATDFDTLAHPEVVSIIEVRRGTTVYLQDVDFELEPGPCTRAARIHWMDIRPPVGEFYSIEYMRRSRLQVLLDSVRPARGNMADQTLVQRLNLTILPLTGEENQ